MEFYTKAFVHVNLNTGTAAEILLVPGAGNKKTGVRRVPPMDVVGAVRQGNRTSTVGQEATDKLKQYVFIPIDLNKATDDCDSVDSGVIGSPAMLARVQGIPAGDVPRISF
jgi:hypothetical protein